MPKSRHRRKPPRKTAPAKPSTPQELEYDESPRPRNKLQAIAAVLIVLLIAISLLVSILMPFFPLR